MGDEIHNNIILVNVSDLNNIKEVEFYLKKYAIKKLEVFSSNKLKLFNNMQNSMVNKMWSDAVTESKNRTTGSFRRAVWYGGSNIVSKTVVGDKGVRKMIRNAPGKYGPGIIGKALKESPIPDTICDIYDKTVEYALMAGKYVYKKKNKQIIFNKPLSSDEKFRKEIKKNVKKLKEGEGLKVIDRNLVKLKDAKKKVSPKIQEMMKVVNVGNNNPMGAKNQKEITLVKPLIESLEKINTNLDNLNGSLHKTLEETITYIEEYVSD